MQKLIPVTIYVPTKEENLDIDNIAIEAVAQGCGYSTNKQRNEYFFKEGYDKAISTFEKQPNSYVFTEDELREILSDSFSAGDYYGTYAGLSINYRNLPNKDQYINNLLK